MQLKHIKGFYISFIFLKTSSFFVFMISTSLSVRNMWRLSFAFFSLMEVSNMMKHLFNFML